MNKLFEIHVDDQKLWASAPNTTKAREVIREKVFEGKRKIMKINEVTKNHIEDDGLKSLLESNYEGLLQQMFFMLSTCVEMNTIRKNDNVSNISWTKK